MGNQYSDASGGDLAGAEPSGGAAPPQPDGGGFRPGSQASAVPLPVAGGGGVATTGATPTPPLPIGLQLGGGNRQKGFSPKLIASTASGPNVTSGTKPPTISTPSKPALE